LLHQVIFTKTVLEKAKGTRQALIDFEEVARKIQVFVESVLAQGWFKRMMSWKATADDIEDMQQQLEQVYKALQFGAVLNTLAVVSSVQEEGEKIEAMIAKAGGAERLVGNPEMLQKLIGGFFRPRVASRWSDPAVS
jgi:hypothetical protein